MLSLQQNKKNGTFMKATLYSEEQKVEPLDEQHLAIASEKPTKVEPPRQAYYIIDYKTLIKPTIIALVIFAVWAVATYLL